MSFDNAYEAITEDNDSRWAFGTAVLDASAHEDHDDPLSGMDTDIPSGVDADDLAAYCVMLGDDALIMSHRLQEWCTNLPELEDEVAIANIGLDLLGQARMLLARGGRAESPAVGGSVARSEDDFVFFRAEADFRNVRLVEPRHEDFGQLIAVLVVFATWRLALLSRLVDSADPVLAAIAAKGVKEATYHRDYAARWAIRLGDGTAYSHERMAKGMTGTWRFVAELFTEHPVESRLCAAGIGADPTCLRAEFDQVLDQVLSEATVPRPDTGAVAGVSGKAGRDGVHTEEMGFLLAELQSVARAHPEARW